MHTKLSRKELVDLVRDLLQSQRITKKYREKLKVLTDNVPSPDVATLHIMRVRELRSIISSLRQMDAGTRMRAIRRMEQADVARLIDCLIEDMTPEGIVDAALVRKERVCSSRLAKN